MKQKPKMMIDKDAGEYSEDFRVAILRSCPYCKSRLILFNLNDLEGGKREVYFACETCSKFFKLKEGVGIQNERAGIIYDTEELKPTQGLIKELRKYKEKLKRE